jgi:hypothetical protein
MLRAARPSATQVSMKPSIPCCVSCAVVLGENIFYETWLFIVEMRVLLGFISLIDLI